MASTDAGSVDTLKFVGQMFGEQLMFDYQLSESIRTIHRRAFLADGGLGFTGLALGAMLARDGVLKASEPEAWQPPSGQAHFTPRAKSVVWLFMNGGVSHAES